MNSDSSESDLYYEVHKGDGPPLLMVHGFLSSRAQWLDNIEPLKRKCTPVIVELYGHGRSPAPQDNECYKPASYIHQFEKIRRELEYESWFLCGYSLGAGLTTRYALEYPEKVSAHIFTNSTSGFAEEESSRQYKEAGEELITHYQESGLEAVENIAVHPRRATKLPEHIKKALLNDCDKLDPVAIGKTIVHTNGNVSVREIISENTRPALLIYGEKEKRFLRFKEFLLKEMPLLDIVELDAGHAVNAENPQGFNLAVTEFIDKHRG